jgi:hypothetical protein
MSTSSEHSYLRQRIFASEAASRAAVGAGPRAIHRYLASAYQARLDAMAGADFALPPHPSLGAPRGLTPARNQRILSETSPRPTTASTAKATAICQIAASTDRHSLVSGSL